MSEYQSVYLAKQREAADADYGVLPPFDPTTLRTAFPVATQHMIVDWFISGKTVDYLVRWFHCEVADIEHVLRVALDASA